MCRYAFSGPYKEKFACFRCRKVFKQANRRELRNLMRTDEAGKRLVACPECAAPMRDMGLDFKAPRQSDLRQWRKVELLFAQGYAYHSCGCGPGTRPKVLWEIPRFLEEQAHERQEQKRRSENYSKAYEREKQRSERRRAQGWARAEKVAKRQCPSSNG